MINSFDEDQIIPSFDDSEHGLVRLIRLARRTGDTLIVTDSDGDRPVAIVPIDRYENLIGEQDLMEEEWDLGDEFYVSDEEEESVLETPDVSLEADFQDDTIPNINDASPDESSLLSAESQKMPIEADDAAGEEQFYLEPIE